MFLLKLMLVLSLSYSLQTKQLPNNIFQTWKRLTMANQFECLLQTEPRKNDIELLYLNHRMPQNRQFGCYLGCLYEKIKVLKPDGEIDLNPVLDQATYMTPELTEKCVHQASAVSGPCEKGFILSQCVYESLAN